MKEGLTRIDEAGRVVIPARYRKALGIKPGDELVLLLEEDALRLTGLQQSVRRAQALVRRYIPEGRSLSNELIEERRREAARE